MWKNVASPLKDIATVISSDGDVKKIFRPMPKIKPPRRQPATKNVTQKGDYYTEAVRKFREEGGDYQRIPEKIKKLRREQRKRLRERLKEKQPLKAALIDQELQAWQNIGNPVDPKEFSFLCDRRGFDEDERQILAEELLDANLIII
jgi:ribosome recycling factor